MTEIQENEIQNSADVIKPIQAKRSPFLLILVILALLAAGYAAYTSWMLRQGVLNQEKSIQKELSTITAQHDELTHQINAEANQSNSFEDQVKQLNQQVQLLLQKQTEQGNDWVLLKARYYLELAQINSYWSDTPDVISALLSQAETLLSNLHDQRVMEVRKLLTEENARVRSMSKVDVMGLLSQLQAAQEASRHLQTAIIPEGLQNSQQVMNGQEEVENQTLKTWKGRFEHSLNLLKKLVIVRHVDEEVKPLITPAYTALLRENIGLILQETQFAVIQSNEPLYHFTLKQANEKITQWFDSQDPKTQSLLTQLKDLEKITLSSKKIEIGQALTLLNQIINDKTSAPVENKKSDEDHSND